MINIKINKKNYGERTILENLTLQLATGEFIALLGESGCGKTTLFNLMTCIDKNFDGEVEINDAFSMIFQERVLLEMLSVYENLKIVDASLTEQRIGVVLKQLGISHIKFSRIQECSVGELQRVKIARAILSGSKVIFADEPTSSLDFISTQKIMEILKRLNDSGYTIFLITHSIHCASYAQKVLLLQEKTIKDSLNLTDNLSENSNLIYQFIFKNTNCIF